MPRITIQQFHQLLTTRSSANAAVRAYRELARRPDLAGEMPPVEWSYWTSAPAAAPT